MHAWVERRSTLLGVSLLGYPDQLVEIEAIVVVNPDTQLAANRIAGPIRQPQDLTSEHHTAEAVAGLER